MCGFPFLIVCYSLPNFVETICVPSILNQLYYFWHSTIVKRKMARESFAFRFKCTSSDPFENQSESTLNNPIGEHAGAKNQDTSCYV